MAHIFCQSKEYRDLTLLEIAELTEQHARDYLAELRWGSTTTMPCPFCDKVDTHYPRRNRGQWRCKSCDGVFSVTSGTLFANRKLSLKRLLLLFYVFISSPKGVSANQFHAQLGIAIGSAYQNLSKLREVLWEQRDLTPLSGVVQIDGGHFCGKPRRPRVRNKPTAMMVNSKLRNRKAGMVPGNGGFKLESWNQKKLKNRRVVVVMRQLSEVEGRGAIRSIVTIVEAETARQVIPEIKKYVVPGSTIQTDDGHAYSSLTAWYDHQSVPHSQMYARDDGVNNNQAESYIARLRRSEYGTHHGMRQRHFSLYANEMAWREDVRFLTLRQKFEDLTTKIFKTKESKIFYRYGCKGKKKTVTLH